MEPSITDWISAFCSSASLLISIGALYFAYNQIKQMNGQLRNMNDTFRNSTLMTVLELENELIRRKVSWDEASFQLREYGINLAKLNENPNEEYLDLLQDKHNTALENYLNSLDRFCYCVLHN